MTEEPEDIATARREGWLGKHETACDPEIYRQIIRDRRFAASLVKRGIVTPDPEMREFYERMNAK